MPKDTVEVIVETEEKEDIPINPQRLAEVWSKLAKKKKVDGRDQLFMLMSQPYDFKDDKITLTLTSPLQEDLINDFRTEIVQYLRKELGNKQIGISTKLVKPESKKMIYTAHEKFNYLAEKHPNLLILKERLGLDPDF